jgi:RES domain-containing protein
MRPGEESRTESSPSAAGVGRPLRARAVCSGPATEGLPVSKLISTDANRWSDEGDATIYLGSHESVAMAEFARHWTDLDRPIAIWRATIRLDDVADLRDPDVRRALRLPDPETWVLDRDRCQRIARELRDRGHDGLVAPSVAFLDDTDRFTIAVFVGNLRRRLEDAVAISRPSHALAPVRPSSVVG